MKHVVDVDMMREIGKQPIVLHVRARNTWRVVLALRWLKVAAIVAAWIGGVRLEIDDEP